MAKKINRSKVILSDLVDKKTVERILKTLYDKNFLIRTKKGKYYLQIRIIKILIKYT